MSVFRKSERRRRGFRRPRQRLSKTLDCYRRLQELRAMRKGHGVVFEESEVPEQNGHGGQIDLRFVTRE